ncbi:MAG: GNAT family N-acetyltransferase [Gemmatimonadaceae bacterium]
MHKIATARVTKRAPRTANPRLSLTHIVRGAMAGDVADIHEFVALNATRGFVLPRTTEEIALAVDDYIVVTDTHGRVRGAAALQEYSPALGEVVSVVVADSARGEGLGSMVVLGVEAMARRRGIDELFALTLADRFFESLGYRRTGLDRYPEKLARYETLAQRGVTIVPKSCYRKGVIAR